MNRHLFPAALFLLGLAIVARIAARAGTDLRLTSPLPGQTRGFRAALRLIPLETDERTKP